MCLKILVFRRNIVPTNELLFLTPLFKNELYINAVYLNKTSSY